MAAQTTHTGKIWTIEQERRKDGRIFEVAKRTPGVRLIICSGGNILLSKEKRHELSGEWDLRLPGGKIFDGIYDWLETDISKLMALALSAAVNEAHEECGLIIDEHDLSFVNKDINGGKGEWDLYYFTTSTFGLDPNGPSFSGSEADEIEGWAWFSKHEALKLALDCQNGMSESRSARYVAAWASGSM